MCIATAVWIAFVMLSYLCRNTRKADGLEKGREWTLTHTHTERERESVCVRERE